MLNIVAFFMTLGFADAHPRADFHRHYHIHHFCHGRKYPVLQDGITYTWHWVYGHNNFFGKWIPGHWEITSDIRPKHN